MEKKFMNRFGYSDIQPYEVVLSIGKKSFLIRALRCVHKNKNEFIEGDFIANYKNNREQEWEMFSDESNPLIKVRFHNDGKYYDSGHDKYVLSDKPFKFYNFNF